MFTVADAVDMERFVISVGVRFCDSGLRPTLRMTIFDTDVSDHVVIAGARLVK